AFSTIVAETWIAFILISAGASKLVYAFQTRNNDQGFIWKLLLSILYVATGVMLFVYPLTGVLTLTLLLGSFLLTEGVFELILAFRLRPQQNWTWALGNGIITLLLGAMIWFQWPFNAPWLIGTLVGVSVLFTGVSRVMLSLNARSAISHADTATSA
ncbi:MAG: HdeD family acid-resistance protein, partial [Microcoleus sp. SIO2G3]|nr:HdeD family acid-resistance protein [Microcoleus sp. SIO2G3]